MTWTCSRCGKAYRTNISYARGGTCTTCYAAIPAEERAQLPGVSEEEAERPGISPLSAMAYVGALIFLVWGIYLSAVLGDVVGPSLLALDPAATGVFRGAALALIGVAIDRVEAVLSRSARRSV